MADAHSSLSSFRESLLEHAFIHSVLQEAWHRNLVIEVLRPEVDSGVDIVFEAGTVVRHVQLKSTQRGSKVNGWNVHLSLAMKPSAAVVLIEFTDEAEGMHLDYRFFGGPPGHPLELDDLRVAKHSKGNAQGVKLERAAIRIVPIGRFERVADVAELFTLLFGASSPAIPQTSHRLERM
jgi:hypothetical protein